MGIINRLLIGGGTSVDFTTTNQLLTNIERNLGIYQLANMLDSNNNQLQDSQGNNLQCLI